MWTDWGTRGAGQAGCSCIRANEDICFHKVCSHKGSCPSPSPCSLCLQLQSLISGRRSFSPRAGYDSQPYALTAHIAASQLHHTHDFIALPPGMTPSVPYTFPPSPGVGVLTASEAREMGLPYLAAGPGRALAYGPLVAPPYGAAVDGFPMVSSPGGALPETRFYLGMPGSPRDGFYPQGYPAAASTGAVAMAYSMVPDVGSVAGVDMGSGRPMLPVRPLGAAMPYATGSPGRPRPATAEGRVRSPHRAVHVVPADRIPRWVGRVGGQDLGALVA